MGNNIAPAGWLGLNDTPPKKYVEVIDGNGNTALAIPTYIPFEVVKMQGDEGKAWGWRGTPVFYEDGKSRWDGGWLINVGMNVNHIGDVIGWRPAAGAPDLTW